MTSADTAPTSPVPGQAGKVLTVWALTASGSFEAENEALLDKIAVSTDSGGGPGFSCQAQDSSRPRRKVKYKGVIVALCLWLAYTLCNAAYSTIKPFFPQKVCSTAS